MLVFDTSSMIYAWDNYPANQFPPLWEWMSEEITAGQIVMPQVAFDEVAQKSPDCATWLRKQNLQLLDVSDAIIRQAMSINALLEIKDDKYFGNGVGENDILIIATAKIMSIPLVTDESRQTNLPKVKGRYKIPAVCGLPEVGVTCNNFIEIVKKSGKVFR